MKTNSKSTAIKIEEKNNKKKKSRVYWAKTEQKRWQKNKQ
jgi:hypothetical protein